MAIKKAIKMLNYKSRRSAEGQIMAGWIPSECSLGHMVRENEFVRALYQLACYDSVIYTGLGPDKACNKAWERGVVNMQSLQIHAGMSLQCNI